MFEETSGSKGSFGGFIGGEGVEGVHEWNFIRFILLSCGGIQLPRHGGSMCKWMNGWKDVTGREIWMVTKDVSREKVKKENKKGW